MFFRSASLAPLIHLSGYVWQFHWHRTSSDVEVRRLAAYGERNTPVKAVPAISLILPDRFFRP
jgi:hypothetical protein